MIEENVEKLLADVPKANPFGEQVTVVAAVKMQTVEDINRAISAGISDIGDNHVQEFRDKYDGIEGNPTRHFIGTLQTNKIKYLLGKVNLYHSLDRMNLADELNKRSEAKGIVSNVLIEVNVGCELSKNGFKLEEVDEAYRAIREYKNLKVLGLMGMLPLESEESVLRPLATAMRKKYDQLRENDKNFKYLSMGMSGDWKLCVECGSNMIRVGTTIFGHRNYQK